MQADAWVRERLGGYVRLSIEERREAVAQLAEDGLSQREIAAVVGVDQATVSRDVRDANASEAARKPVPPWDRDPAADANATPRDFAAVDRATGEIVSLEEAMESIAAVVGSSHETVRRDLAATNVTTEDGVPSDDGGDPADAVTNVAARDFAAVDRATGEIPTHDLGNRVRILRPDLDRWAASR